MKRTGVKIFIISALLIAAALTVILPAPQDAKAAGSVTITPNPANGAAAVLADSGRVFTVTFNTAVTLTAGYTPYIYWYDPSKSSWAASSAPCTNVTVSGGDTVSFSLPAVFSAGLHNNTVYGIMLPGPDNTIGDNTGYAADADGNKFPGIDYPSSYTSINEGLTGRWTFKTALSYENPALNTTVPMSPAMGTINVDPNAEIHLYFNQPINRNTGKYIEIYRYDNDVLVKQIGSDSDQVEITGTSSQDVKILGQGLQKNTKYYITISGGAFISSWNSLPSQGVSGKNLYFTTTSTYEVKFFVDGTQYGETQTVDYNTAAAAPSPIPTKNGYVFNNWDADYSHITSNLNINAVFRQLFTLKYTAGANGSIKGANPQEVAQGGNGTSVTAAADTGYHFVKWSDGNTNANRTDTNVQGNIDVTAEFAVNTYVLRYTAGAGGTLTAGKLTGLPSYQQSVAYMESGIAVTAIPNTGYHFIKWSDGKTDAARTDTEVAGDVTVTAEFSLNPPVTHTLTYIAGDNGIIEGTTTQTVVHGNNGTQVKATPALGYHFVQWSDGVTSAARTDTGVTADKSVTAAFEINTYTLKYAAGEHGSLTGELEQSVEYGGSGTLVKAAADKHYHFVKWSDDVITASRTDKNVVKNINVTAVFAIDKYKVTFEDYDGIILKTQNVAYGSDATPPDDPEREGYTFSGWDGDYNDITETTVLTAVYDINTYKVTFADFDGKELKTQSINYGASAVPPAEPKREGYTFTGWDGDFTKIKGTVTFTAQYRANMLKVTFADYDGKVIGAQDVEYGKDAKAPADPEMKGYVFAGWDTAFTGVTADITVKAQYKAMLIVTQAGRQDGKPVVAVNAGGLNVVGVTAESGKAKVNPNGTISLELPEEVKAGDVEVTLKLADGTTVTGTITITDEAIAAIGPKEDKTGPPIWLWAGVGALAVIAAILTALFVRRLRAR